MAVPPSPAVYQSSSLQRLNNMSGYKNFAVLGAGTMGGPIISALLAAKSAGTVSRVVVLSRSDSKSSVPDGAEVARVDYESHSSLTKALAGIDVVISTVAVSALHRQAAMARAAKEAGTKLFVLSSFGLADDMELDMEEARALVNLKVAANKDVQAILPTASFFTGGFSDWVWHQPFLNISLATGKVTIGGDGNAPISFTSRDDIGRFVTHVLTSLPPTRLENKIFRIQGDYASFNEVFLAYEEKHNVKLEVTRVPIEEMKKKAKETPEDFINILHLIWAQGHGTVGKPLDNGLWPEWKPKKVVEFL